MALLAKRHTPQTGQLSRASRWDPFEVMHDLMRWGDPVRTLSPIFGEEPEFFPTFDVKETKDSYLFKGDLPGMKEADVEVSLTGNRLTISGQREDDRKDEGDQYYAHERTYGAFVRTFTLPEGIDAENVQAEFADGVLAVRIPKKAAAQPKKIELKASTTQLGSSRQIKAGSTASGNPPLTGPGKTEKPANA